MATDPTLSKRSPGKKQPVTLVILDGWGYSENKAHNAIAQASTPNWDKLWQSAPHSLISGSGRDVGLPDGQMGNSEVGHMTLGAGRVIQQDFTRLSNAIADGSFYANPVLKEAIGSCNKMEGVVHIMGLLSPGGVHSHENHIKAVIELAFNEGASSVYLHAFLDGRDVPPASAMPSLTDLENWIQAHGRGGIASVMGRFYAMDRDNRWDRTQLAYDLLTGKSLPYQANSPQEALSTAYARAETDEFVAPTAILMDGKCVPVRDNDCLIFMNFRADRARQLSRAFVNPEFDGFKRAVQPQLAAMVTLTRYADDIPASIAYEPVDLSNSLGEIISSHQLTQLRLAETEKYAHVTFFFSCGREEIFPGEKRILIPSPRVDTYDLKPEMSAEEVTDALVLAIETGDCDLIVCNYANGDMVGHTGDLEAAVKAVAFLDKCIGRVIEATRRVNGHCLITADHGNVEKMKDPDSEQPHTAHTSERVPLVYAGHLNLVLDNGTLADIAPTILNLMDLPRPVEMTGRSLIEVTVEKTGNG
ncbi:MAG: 2,3-bisphosphoglycerate-independent phosphoglycerate mutase [Gammaproteobacteria bacterium]|nr:2,3-bisphosphoglycerate-independent phosphoglycerate mutase [Gammaproteobacteria bacterium]